MVFGIAVLFLYGLQPERRYSGGFGCGYRMVYNSTEPIGLMIIGGSRIYTATADLDKIDELLDEQGIQHNPSHSLAHSINDAAGEHILLRDIIPKRKIKTVLIGLKPRRVEEELAEWVVDVAGFYDLLNLWHYTSGWDFSNRIDILREVIVNHLKPTNGGLPPNILGSPTKICGDPADYRLDLVALYEAEKERLELYSRKSVLDWDIQDETQRPLVENIQKMKRFADLYNVQLIYILMTGTNEVLPTKQLQEDFFNITGTKLITIDKEIQHRLSEAGRRDAIHINAVGREWFTPWLIEQVQKKCIRKEGCF